MNLTKFEELWKVVKTFDIERKVFTEVKEFHTKGVLSNLSDVFEIDGQLCTVLKNGTISKTIVYISEKSKHDLDKYKSYPKYHIFNCEQMKKMKKEDRAYRYKKALKNDGSFLIIVTDNENKKSYEEFVQLEICGYCLSMFNKTNFTRYTKKTFLIKQHLSNLQLKTNELNCEYFKNDFETVPRFYANNWIQISRKMKENRNFICEQCNINLSKRTEFLNTHHMNGNPKNNEIANLKVLCIECHSNQYNHSHIKDNEEYFNYLKYKESLTNNENK